MTFSHSLASESEPVRTALRLLIVGFLLLAVLRILWPFLPSLLWSAFIVISAWPGLAWLQRRWRWSRGACGWLLGLVLVGFVIGPLLTGVVTLTEHGDSLLIKAKTAVEQIPAEPPAWIENIPLVGSDVAGRWREAATGPDNLKTRLTPVIHAGGRWLLGQLGAVGEEILQFLLVVVFTLVFYRYGETLDALTGRLAERLGGEGALKVRDQARQAIRAVALGVGLTALIQAGLALIGLLLAGVPLAAVLTFVCFLLAIAQVGAALPILLAALWLYWQGHSGGAAFLTLWGLFVVGSVDNILRPLLITRGLNMPLTLVFIGVIGGLLAHGLIGVFLGPTLVAIVYMLLLAWIEKPDSE